MIVNRQLLELMGVCGESLEHFTNVVGGGDVNFQMSLDDSVRYLRGLEASDPETYGGWADLVDGYNTDPRYIKAAAQYAYGDYVLIGHAGQAYPTIEAARTAREAKRTELYAQEWEKFDGQFYISAVVCCQGGETMQKTTSPIEGCKYLVFNPKTGEHERFDAFAFAQSRLAEIEREVIDPMVAVQIGRQIVVDGAVVAVDILEDE